MLALADKAGKNILNKNKSDNLCMCKLTASTVESCNSVSHQI